MNNETGLKERLESINERIAKSCQKSGRKESHISILPVSKNFPSDTIRKAICIPNMKRFGENRVQEIQTKYNDLLDCDLKWVMVGHLQINKVNTIVNYVEEIQSLDRLELAQAIDRQLQKKSKNITAMVQIKTSPEITKYGLSPNDLLTFIQTVSDNFPSIKINGLMTISELTEDNIKIRECFRLLRRLRDHISKYNIPSVNLEQLSMGMSNDFEIAIEEGATEIRLGSALFGQRQK